MGLPVLSWRMGLPGERGGRRTLHYVPVPPTAISAVHIPYAAIRHAVSCYAISSTDVSYAAM
eukprot:3238353-Rhodomonas_salina.1